MTPNYRLKITRDGTLLSVAHDEEITPAQLSIIKSILKAPDLTYGEVLKFLAERGQVFDLMDARDEWDRSMSVYPRND